MDTQLTESIKNWLEAKEGERNLEVGALLLLKLTRNAVAYRNMCHNLPRYEKNIEYQLRKYYNFRVQQITHEQVEELQKQADEIEKKHYSYSDSVNKEEFKKGKRADHELLPDEIKALFVENLSILQRMREVHLQLRNISENPNFPCKDSDRFPFLKELIELDKRSHENWETYDNFVIAPSETKSKKKTSAVKKPAAKATKKKTKK